MRALRTALLILEAGIVSAVGCRGDRPAASERPGHRVDRTARMTWSRTVEAAEAPLEAALWKFDAAARSREPSRMKEAAVGALAEARKARDTLESVPVPPEIVYARWEELIFINHLVPGFQAFLASAAGPRELAVLDSIRRRAERHRDRGREAVKAAG